MKIRIDEKPPLDRTKTHCWFAWYPVRIGPYLVWLQLVMRKGQFHDDSLGGAWSYEYEFPAYYP